MLETKIKLQWAMPALRKASSKDANFSLCTPTPFVKNIFLGTMLLF